MNLTENPLYHYLPFLAMLAPLALFWGQARAFVLKILNLFVVQAEYTGMAETIFTRYLNGEKKYRLGQYSYNAFSDYTIKDKKRLWIGYELIGTTPQIYWIDGWPIVAYMYTNNNNPAKLKIFAIRKTFDPEKHYLKAIKQFNGLNGKPSTNKAFAIYYKTGRGNMVMMAESNKPVKANAEESQSNPWENAQKILGYEPSEIGYRQKSDIELGYVFCKDAQGIVNECKQWRNSEEWYKARGILYRRGFLLSGVAGTGKSSLVRKICQILDIPLFIFDLASMSNNDMINAWKEVQAFSPCAVLFDDLDRIFDGSKNVSGEKSGGLTFDCLLGCISGAMPAEGILTFATVNNPEKLDPALGVIKDGRPSRPGRFDTIVTLGPLVREDRIKLAEMIFKDISINIEKIVGEGEGMSAAQFNEYYTKIALNEYWKNVSNIEFQPNTNELACKLREKFTESNRWDAIRQEPKNQDKWTPI